MTVLIDRQRGFTVLTLARPAQRNALDASTRDALDEAFATAEADPGAAAIVITGQGQHFCAGGDMAMLSTMTPDAVADLLAPMHRLLRRMACSAKLSIAAVEGFAAGGGAGLAMACDVVVMARDATLAMEFHRIGLVPDCGLLHTLPRRVGAARARALLLAPRRIGGPEAVAMGLADVISESGAARAQAEVLAKAAAGVPPQVREWTRRLLPAVPLTLDVALQGEIDAQRQCISSDDFRDGVQRFLDGQIARVPRPKGTTT